MDANSNQGPPSVGPGVPGAMAQAVRRLLCLESCHLSYDADGIVGPAAIDLASQHEQAGLRRGMDISIPAALGRDGVLQGSAVMSGCRSPGIASACVHTDDSDITEERDPPSSANS